MSALTLAAKLASVPSCPLGDRHPGSVTWTHEAGPSSSSSRQPASARLLQQRQGASPKGKRLDLLDFAGKSGFCMEH